jgi:hypothetical protein
VKELNQLMKSVVNHNKIVILGIPIEKDREETEIFLKEFNPTYEQWKPPQNLLKALAKGHTNVPKTLLLTKKGDLVREWNEAVVASSLVSEIEQFETLGRKKK